jgi:hypothetical protein
MGQSLTTIRTERPGFSGAGIPPAVLITSNLYNTAGQLIRTSEYSSLSASAPLRENLFSYDSLGAQTRSGLDLNRNGVLDLSGPDRVSESRSWYKTDSSNNYWQVSASILYPHDGSAAPVTNALQKTQLTGLGGPGAPNAVSLSKDMLGNTTISRTFVDPATRTVTQTTTYRLWRLWRGRPLTCWVSPYRTCAPTVTGWGIARRSWWSGAAA